MVGTLSGSVEHGRNSLVKLLISASYVNTPEDIQSLLKIPCDAALIGNSVMKAEDRVGFLRSLTGTVNKS